MLSVLSIGVGAVGLWGQLLESVLCRCWSLHVGAISFAVLSIGVGAYMLEQSALGSALGLSFYYSPFVTGYFRCTRYLCYVKYT